MRYSVKVTNLEDSAGIGPIEVAAVPPEEARGRFLVMEAMTEEELLEYGLTEWEIVPISSL